MSSRQIAPAKALDIYSRMNRIRQFEHKVGELFRSGQLPGFVHLYIGEEAVAAGVCATLNDHDYIVSTHRGHGHAIAKGGDVNRMMAELFGKATGYCKGKGGSMHIADFDIGMLGACGIVGGGLPICVGAGLSAAYNGTDQVSVAFFGDGAANEGSFHESLNLAAAWELPCIFVCENNRYGEFTPVERTMKVSDIADRATGYGMPGIAIDGCDAFAVHEAAENAVERARRGEGPTLIEAKTHRIGDHAEGEAAFLGGQEYRPREEREQALAADPLPRMRSSLIELGLADAAELDELETAVSDAIECSVEFARGSAQPANSVLDEDCWV